jgi:predicted CXXCH cytochrome family protein
MTSMTKSLSQASLVRTEPIDWHQHQLACSDCHREHQGPEHNLQSISSQRCQACHQNQFNAFADGHPEFSQYPDPSTGRIAFDHARHRDLHFAKSSAEFDCRKCHVNGAEQGRVGQVFRSVAFESACASCHTAPMKSSLSDGIVVFQLPSIDLKRLAQHGSPIANWPSESGQLLDGSVPPWMQWMLMSDEDAKPFFDRLTDGGKLTDFNLDRPEDRQAIVGLAAASQRLLGQLASGGQQELLQRLTAAFDPQNTAFTEQLVRGVPPDLFRQAYQDWFEHHSSKQLVSNALRVSSKQSIRTVADRKAIEDPRYLETTDIEKTQRESDEKDLLSSGNELLSDSSDSLGELSLLREAPLKEDALLSGSPDSSELSSANSKDSFSSSAWKQLKPIKHLEAGGWMIDRQRMAIVYVPSGHADPWLTAMLTFASRIGDSIDRSAATQAVQSATRPSETIAKSILAKDGIGRCLECHPGVKVSNMRPPIEPKPSDFLATSHKEIDSLWQANRFDVRVRQLTRFDHGPHLLQPSLMNCVACHRMVENHSDADGIPHRDFESMAVTDCASCHQPKAAGDHCTQCHNYHTNSIEPQQLKMRSASENTISVTQ